MMGRTDRKLSGAAWLTTGGLPRLLGVLDCDGEEARVVGGAVRNALLDVPIAEIDVATTAVPDEVVKRVTAAGFKPVPTGIEHGTVTVVIDKHPFEVTTLRKDVETYGRHAKVEFGRDWKVDAERRDFSINAMSATRDGTVYDYAGGLDDLAQRRVRFIGDPKKRIAEDYLRILRFFRFHAAYGSGRLDADGLAACIAGRDGLDQLSRERVRMELMKLLVAAHAAPTLTAMADAGLLLRVLGGVPYLAAFGNMVKVEVAIGAEPNAVRRLGALGVAIAEDAERLWQKLRLANNEHERLVSMGDGWGRISPLYGEKAAKALLYRLRPQQFHRSRAARLGALGCYIARYRMARACDFAATLDRAGVSVEGSGFHEARPFARSRARRGDSRGGASLDRRGISQRSAGARCDRGRGCAPVDAQLPSGYEHAVMNLFAGFHDISFFQLIPVPAVALFASIVGGVSGYGTGALMPLVLVPLVGAEPVVPIIAISAMFTNSSRVFAFLKYADWRRAAIVLAAAVPTCVLGAWGYTKLSSAGAALVIGGMLILSVPLRRLLKYHGVKFGDGGLALGSLGYGVVVGGTAGSGVILLSLLMATGVEGAGVIATDAAISIVIGIVKISVFGLAGVITAQVIAFAFLIGIVALPGAFLAKAFVERMPVHMHTAILDAVVLFGGVFLVWGALR